MPARLLPACLFVVIATATPVEASTFTWQFSGLVTGSVGPGGTILEPLIPLGTPVVFAVSFDTLATDACSLINRGWFSLPSATVSILGSTYAADTGNAGLEVNNPAGNCASGSPPETVIQDYVQRFGFLGAPFYGGFLHWTAPGEGDEIPSVLPSSADFTLNYGCGLVCQDGLVGEITVVQAVPEPSSLLLLGTGGLGLLGSGCRKRRDNRVHRKCSS